MKLKILLLFSIILLLFSFNSCKKENKDQSKTSDENIETFEGYLMDVACGGQESALDKSDTVHSPQDHTKHCLSVCYSSGYGISVKDKDSNTYTFIPFNTEAKDDAYAIIKNTTKEKGIQIIVTGKLENGVINVKTIEEKI